MGLGPPDYPGDYRLLAIDGVNLHLPCDLDAPFPLTITLHSLFGYKTLHLEGWKII